MNNELLDAIKEPTDNPDDITETGECFDKTIPVENGDSVIFTVDNSNDVLLGKYVEKYNCVITSTGVIVDRKHIEEWFNIPFNVIQEKLYTKAFCDTYNKLVNMNSEVFKKNQIEEYIENDIVRSMGTLDDDSQFLIGLFTRNVRNEKIDFENYKFMMDILFNREDIQYTENIDLRNLNAICFNMYSIMNKIAKETYDKIYEMLASHAPDKSLV